ncbi:MAG: UDP-N-acetylenolpyruvoylglucosamine reductase [Bryobacterales bacterium]|jgi:UDP-N-acetylmuramate dehydrogenase|nr:UDP-N-acetylenolpyruvoylglucosamine reductase [Bryobacterales bacterium]
MGIGGPAALYLEAATPEAFIAAQRLLRSEKVDVTVIGEGSNLIVADAGFQGAVLRLVNREMRAEGSTVHVDGGVTLQTLVDFTVAQGLQGLETMTGIPGSVGAAVYGNAGAYGHSISERVVSVRFHDGEAIREFDSAACEFHYRESIFKKCKAWVIVSATLAMAPGDSAVLHEKAAGILDVRNRKYPPTMKCAGSIFKNFLLANLPPEVAAQVPAKVIIEGKIPSAWFLEQVGAKGIRLGGIQVADYHANLIYNDGGGTARDLRTIIADLQQRIQARFGIPLEEEVQYIGFA